MELRFFGGLSVEETAEVLKVSTRTVMRDWKLGKAWLLRAMNGEKRVAQRGGAATKAMTSTTSSGMTLVSERHAEDRHGALSRRRNTPSRKRGSLSTSKPRKLDRRSGH